MSLLRRSPRLIGLQVLDQKFFSSHRWVSFASLGSDFISKHYIILNKSIGGDAGIVLCSCRVVKSHRLFRKLLVGVSVGVPLVVGVQYAVSEPRERRKMKILAEGVGRFCR